MNTGIILGVLLLCVIVFAILSLSTNKEEVFIAIAGSVEKQYQVPRTISIPSLSKYNIIDKEDNNINLKMFQPFYIKGNSMSSYQIPDASLVLVSPINDADKGLITNYPILLYKIHYAENNQGNNSLKSCRYKLRKFVRYIHSEDEFQSWLEKNRGKEDFDVNFYQMKHDNFINKYAKPSDFIYTISITMDDNTNKKSYSFHSKDLIYGRVVHVIPCIPLK